MRCKKKLTESEYRKIMRLDNIGGYSKRTLISTTIKWYKWCVKYTPFRQQVHLYNMINNSLKGEEKFNHRRKVFFK